MNSPVIELYREPDGWVSLLIATDDKNILIISTFKENIKIIGSVNGESYKGPDIIYTILDLTLDKLNEGKLIC